MKTAVHDDMNGGFAMIPLRMISYRIAGQDPDHAIHAPVH